MKVTVWIRLSQLYTNSQLYAHPEIEQKLLELGNLLDRLIYFILFFVVSFLRLFFFSSWPMTEQSTTLVADVSLPPRRSQ